MSDTVSRQLAEIPTLSPAGSVADHAFISHHIVDGRLVSNTWRRLSLSEAESGVALPPDTVLPLAYWLTHVDARRSDIGVWLGPADDPANLASYVSELTLIQIWFPLFTDGRGYSNARLLRERYRYLGELRAVGDVGYDQLHPLSRCGFNAFELNPKHDPSIALGYLKGFSESYQAGVENPNPFYRRRGTHIKSGVFSDV